MKYIISESNIKRLIQKYFNKDLSDNIEIIQSYDDLPMDFKFAWFKSEFNGMLNRFGPAYIIKTNEDNFLVTPGSSWTAVNFNGDPIPVHKIMDYLGIGSLGLSFDQLIRTYGE
jgi:hypothetical protein